MHLGVFFIWRICMNKYYQNTFLFISSKKGLLTPLLRALQWATKNRIERLDIPLIRMGLMEKLLKDSRNHLIIDYDIYKHPQTKEYVLRIRTESEGNTHSIDLEHCRVYLSPTIKLHYLSEERSQLTYINTDSSELYLPIRYKIELYINETYDINYFINLTALKRFLAVSFPTLHIDIFDSFKAIRSKINRYIKSLDTNNWCHIASYESK